MKMQEGRRPSLHNTCTYSKSGNRRMCHFSSSLPRWIRRGALSRSLTHSVPPIYLLPLPQPPPFAFPCLFLSPFRTCRPSSGVLYPLPPPHKARFHKIDGKVRQSVSNDWPQLQCPKNGEFLVVHIALNFMKPPPSLNLLLLLHHARHLFLTLLAFQFRERRMDRRAERRFFKRSNLFLFVFFSPIPEGSPPRPIFVSIRLYGGVGWNGF